MSDAVSAANIALVRRIFIDLFSEGKLNEVDEIFDPDYLDHVVQGPELSVVRGPAAFKAAVSMFRTAFPDLRYTIEDIMASGDKVVTRFTGRGTHLGPFLGVAPTGRAVNYMGIDISRVTNGKVVEGWISYDALGLMRELGIVSQPV
jgi:predicted ester cyclase